MVADFIVQLAQNFEELKLWETTNYKTIQEKAAGIGTKCAIILFELWNKGSSPGIAVDVHVLNVGKALGVIPYDCEDQDLVQNTLEAVIDAKLWPLVNLRFGGLFQFLHLSRGEHDRNVIYRAAMEIGSPAMTMIQLFVSTKQLIAVESLKKEVAHVKLTIDDLYNLAMNR